MCCQMKRCVDGVDKWCKPHDIIRIGNWDYRWDGFIGEEHIPKMAVTIEIPATGYMENTPVGAVERPVPVGHCLLGVLGDSKGSFKLATTGRVSNLNDVMYSKGQMGRKPLAVRQTMVPEIPEAIY